jgi:osmotically-inducible protein OsmY
MMRDRSAAIARRRARRTRRLLRYISSEVYGAGQRAGHALVHRRRELDDATLAAKVRSILFRDGGIPKGNTNINAERGWIYLRGELLSPELIQRAARRAARIEGVRGVKNLLHTPDRRG